MGSKDKNKSKPDGIDVTSSHLQLPDFTVIKTMEWLKTLYKIEMAAEWIVMNARKLESKITDPCPCDPTKGGSLICPDKDSAFSIDVLAAHFEDFAEELGRPKIPREVNKE